jgi:hypothetical protein
MLGFVMTSQALVTVAGSDEVRRQHFLVSEGPAAPFFLCWTFQKLPCALLSASVRGCLQFFWTTASVWKTSWHGSMAYQIREYRFLSVLKSSVLVLLGQRKLEKIGP